MSDADIDSMLAFEENLHNLPLSQEVHSGSCDQEDLEAFFAEAPATPPLISGSTSSVSPSSTTATSGSTPEQPISVVSRKRLRTKTTVPNYVPVRQSIQTTGLDLDFGAKLSLNAKRHVYDCLRAYYMKTVWEPQNPRWPHEYKHEYRVRCRLAFTAVESHERVAMLEKWYKTRRIQHFARIVFMWLTKSRLAAKPRRLGFGEWRVCLRGMVSGALWVL